VKVILFGATGRAMLELVRHGYPVRVLETGDINAIGRLAASGEQRPGPDTAT
jgi:hypothetical protein